MNVSHARIRTRVLEKQVTTTTVHTGSSKPTDDARDSLFPTCVLRKIEEQRNTFISGQSEKLSSPSAPPPSRFERRCPSQVRQESRFARNDGRRSMTIRVFRARLGLLRAVHSITLYGFGNNNNADWT